MQCLITSLLTPSLYSFFQVVISSVQKVGDKPPQWKTDVEILNKAAFLFLFSLLLSSFFMIFHPSEFFEFHLILFTGCQARRLNALRVIQSRCSVTLLRHRQTQIYWASAAESSASRPDKIPVVFHLRDTMTLSPPSHIRSHYTSSLIFPRGSIKYRFLILLYSSRISPNLA